MEKLLPVQFREDTIYLVSLDNEPFVPLKPISENLGLDWRSQHRKLLDTARRWQPKSIKVVAQDGKLREMICIPLRKLPAWLYSISPEKVKPEIREKLVKYQEECDEVLWNYWFARKTPSLPGSPEEIVALSERDRNFRMALEIYVQQRIEAVSYVNLQKILEIFDYLQKNDIPIDKALKVLRGKKLAKFSTAEIARALEITEKDVRNVLNKFKGVKVTGVLL